MNLLRASRIITFEPPPGVKANLLRTFSAVSSTRMSKVRIFILTQCVLPSMLYHAPCTYACRNLLNVHACTSFWPGSMPWCKRGFTTAHWAGLRSMSSMSRTSEWRVTHWTRGWIWWLRLVAAPYSRKAGGFGLCSLFGNKSWVAYSFSNDLAILLRIFANATVSVHVTDM